MTASSCASGRMNWSSAARVWGYGGLSPTTATSALFIATDGGYGFKVRAVDNRSLVEEFTGQLEVLAVVDV